MRIDATPRSEQEFLIQRLMIFPECRSLARQAQGFPNGEYQSHAVQRIRVYPGKLSLEIQADILAQFAATSRQGRLVPIVEPDIDFLRDADLGRSGGTWRSV